jgi:hypothetical protein
MCFMTCRYELKNRSKSILLLLYYMMSYVSFKISVLATHCTIIKQTITIKLVFSDLLRNLESHYR